MDTSQKKSEIVLPVKLFLITALFSLPVVAAAHIPVLVSPEAVDDTVSVSDPEISHAFYGKLLDFPHTYEIRANEPFNLFVQVLQPDIPSSERNIGGIIVRKVQESGRVKEIARLRASEANWESFFEFFGGDSYLSGPTFKTPVDAGVYRVEVNTPDNIGKYVLVIGSEEDFSEIGYIEVVRRIAGVKVFFGKSQLRIIESPFVYVPLLVLSILSFCVWYFFRFRRSRSD